MYICPNTLASSPILSHARRLLRTPRLFISPSPGEAQMCGGVHTSNVGMARAPAHQQRSSTARTYLPLIPFTLWLVCDPQAPKAGRLGRFYSGCLVPSGSPTRAELGRDDNSLARECSPQRVVESVLLRRRRANFQDLLGAV